MLGRNTLCVNVRFYAFLHLIILLRTFSKIFSRKFNTVYRNVGVYLAHLTSSSVAFCEDRSIPGTDIAILESILVAGFSTILFRCLRNIWRPEFKKKIIWKMERASVELSYRIHWTITTLAALLCLKAPEIVWHFQMFVYLFSA